MFQAYLHRQFAGVWAKAHPGDGLAGDASPSLIDYKAVRRQEDTLTSTVFSRLFYLPVARVAPLLQHISVPVVGPIPPLPGGVCWVRFWPWYPRLGSGRREGIEPDLVVEFEDQVWILEAKLHSPQHAEQWRNQVCEVRRTNPRPLWFVAVGGEPSPIVESFRAEITDLACTGPSSIGFSLLSWQALADALNDEVRLAGSDSNAGPLTPHERRVLLDLRLALSDRGFRPRCYLGELPNRIAHGVRETSPGLEERSAGAITTASTTLAAGWPVPRTTESLPDWFAPLSTLSAGTLGSATPNDHNTWRLKP